MITLDGEQFLIVSEAAARLGVKPATIYAYVSRGILKSYRRGIKRQRLYRRAEVEALLRLAPSAGEPPATRTGQPPARSTRQPSARTDGKPTVASADEPPAPSAGKPLVPRAVAPLPRERRRTTREIPPAESWIRD
jgi:excisionase family DNA binding protein